MASPKVSHGVGLPVFSVLSHVYQTKDVIDQSKEVQVIPGEQVTNSITMMNVSLRMYQWTW